MLTLIDFPATDLLIRGYQTPLTLALFEVKPDLSSLLKIHLVVYFTSKIFYIVFNKYHP